MKTKINLPNDNLSEENKELKKTIKFLIVVYKAQKEQIKLQKQIINNHKKIEKSIAETLAKNDIHYVSINDEEFKEYQKKKYLR